MLYDFICFFVYMFWHWSQTHRANLFPGIAPRRFHRFDTSCSYPFVTTTTWVCNLCILAVPLSFDRVNAFSEFCAYFIEARRKPDSVLWNHARPCVRPSVCPWLSFLKTGSLVFSDIVHDDSWQWYLVTSEARLLKKKYGGPNLG